MLKRFIFIFPINAIYKASLIRKAWKKYENVFIPNTACFFYVLVVPSTRHSDIETEKGHDRDKANKNWTKHGKMTFTMQLKKPVTSL